MIFIPHFLAWKLTFHAFAATGFLALAAFAFGILGALTVPRACALRIFTTFCSSIRKARTIFSRKQCAHKTPPKVRETVFNRRLSRGRSLGRVGWIPANFFLHCPHTGTERCFFMYKYTRRPPGVRTLKEKENNEAKKPRTNQSLSYTRRRLERVLYDKRRRKVKRWTILDVYRLRSERRKKEKKISVNLLPTCVEVMLVCDGEFLWFFRVFFELFTGMTLIFWKRGTPKWISLIFREFNTQKLTKNNEKSASTTLQRKSKVEKSDSRAVLKEHIWSESRNYSNRQFGAKIFFEMNFQSKS